MYIILTMDSNTIYGKPAAGLLQDLTDAERVEYISSFNPQWAPSMAMAHYYPNMDSYENKILNSYFNNQATPNDIAYIVKKCDMLLREIHKFRLIAQAGPGLLTHINENRKFAYSAINEESDSIKTDACSIYKVLQYDHVFSVYKAKYPDFCFKHSEFIKNEELYANIAKIAPCPVGQQIFKDNLVRPENMLYYNAIQSQTIKPEDWEHVLSDNEYINALRWICDRYYDRKPIVEYLDNHGGKLSDTLYQRMKFYTDYSDDERLCNIIKKIHAGDPLVKYDYGHMRYSPLFHEMVAGI